MIKETLRALEGLVKVKKIIDVIKKRDGRLGGSVFLAGKKKKRKKRMTVLAFLSATFRLAN